MYVYFHAVEDLTTHKQYVHFSTNCTDVIFVTRFFFNDGRLRYFKLNQNDNNIISVGKTESRRSIGLHKFALC